MFCEVERSYIEDGFNLYGLRACVTNFSDCLDLILDRIGPDDSDDSHLTQSACTLYGLIHARYIITAHGLDAMYNKVSCNLFFLNFLPLQCQLSKFIVPFPWIHSMPQRSLALAR
jgi:casein kinase II subunit beta